MGWRHGTRIDIIQTCTQCGESLTTQNRRMEVLSCRIDRTPYFPQIESFELRACSYRLRAGPVSG